MAGTSLASSSGQPSVRWLTAIVLAGLVLRIAWVLYVNPFPLSDAGWYYDVAGNLAEGRGFVAHHYNVFLEPPGVPLETAYRPPAYPMLLAGVWKVAGVGATPAKLLNAVLDSITIVLVYALGRQMFDRRVALVAAALFALLPNAILWLPLTLSEALFTLLFMQALWTLIAFRDTGTPRAWRACAVFGLLSGLSVLTRGEGLVLLPTAFLFWLARDGRGAALRQISLAAVATLAVVTPWTIRNWVVLDTPIFVASNTGLNLRLGHAPDARGRFDWMNDPVDGVHTWEINRRPAWEAKSYRVYTLRAIKYAFTHPAHEVELTKNKVFYTYRSERAMLFDLTYPSQPIRPAVLADSLGWIIDVSWYTVLFAAVLTTPLWIKRSPERVLPVVVVVLWTSFHVLFFGLPRYHLPLLPLFSICAAAGAFATWGRLATLVNTQLQARP